VFAALAVLLAAACALRGPASADEAAMALEQRQRALFAAVAARDADAVAGLFSESAVLQVAGMPPVEGREAIRRFYGRLFGHLSASSASAAETRVSTGGDLAYSFGATSNEFRTADGIASYAGKFVLVWRLEEGEWNIAVYSISSNQPDKSR
jgi:uncharacterized protein (TIGR02246 family)